MSAEKQGQQSKPLKTMTTNATTTTNNSSNSKRLFNVNARSKKSARIYIMEINITWFTYVVKLLHSMTLLTTIVLLESYCFMLFFHIFNNNITLMDNQ